MGQSDFEQKLGLAALEDDLSARVARTEVLLGLVFGAIIEQSEVGTARTIAGNHFISSVVEHVPSRQAAQEVLNQYRLPEHRVETDPYADLNDY